MKKILLITTFSFALISCNKVEEIVTQTVTSAKEKAQQKATEAVQKARPLSYHKLHFLRFFWKVSKLFLCETNRDLLPHLRVFLLRNGLYYQLNSDSFLFFTYSKTILLFFPTSIIHHPSPNIQHPTLTSPPQTDIPFVFWDCR